MDYTQISFINFVEICDNVLIEIDGKEYQCKDIEFEEPQYKSQTIATIDLRFSIGEIWRSRAASKALGVHGEYDNAEYSDDYNNIF